MSTASRRGFLAAAGGAGAAMMAAAASAPASASAQGATVTLVAGSGGPRALALLSTYVAGSGRYEGRAVIGTLSPGQPLRLVREPGNDYDALSVAVTTLEDVKLGYVPRIHNQAIANLIDAGLEPLATIRAVRPAGRAPDIRLDVTLPVVG